MEICKHINCTGCQLCLNVCTKKAITFKQDPKGFLYPFINTDLCIQCGKCIKYCPANITFNKNLPHKVFAALIKDNQIKKNSTSGGIFYQLATKIIEQNGVVYGAIFEDNKVMHACITQKEELSKLQGSKYVQSNTGYIYNSVKNDLQSGRTVLFSGTPCQIAALKSLLSKIDISNLYLVDLVCHGVPNAQVFKNYLKEIEDKTKSNIINVKFRKKTPDCYSSSISFKFANGNIINNSFATDPYCCLFVENYLIRDSCFYCKYSNTSRNADITLADFWGYKPRKFRFRHYMKGINMVMINSEKGYSLFKSISHSIIQEERTMIEAIRGNKNLSEPQNIPYNYNSFWEDYVQDNSLYKLANKYLPNRKPYPSPYKRYIKSYILTSIPQFIIKLLKK